MPVLDDISLEQYQKLTSLIFTAAVDARKWPDFLQELSNCSGGVYTYIFGHDMKTGLLNKAVYLYQDDYVRDYEDYYGNDNAWLPGFFKQTVGIPVAAELMIPREALQKTEFYNDWVKPQENITGGGGALLHKDDSRMFVFGGNIRAKDTEKLEARWMRLVELITPNLQHAFEISRTLGGLGLEKAITEQSFVGKKTAVAILSTDGLVVYSNVLAQTMLASGTFVRLTLGGTFNFSDDRFAEFLDRALASLATRDTDVFYSFPIFSEMAADSYFCSMTRFDPTDLDAIPLVANSEYSQPCLLLTLTEIDQTLNIISVLNTTFGLTTAEATVVDLLTSDQTLQQISQHRKVSLHTVRNQLKSAMSKTGKHRQVDLSKLVEQLRLYGRLS